MNFTDLKDVHAGEEIIIIGNGPSLRNVPIGFLDSRPTIVTNFFRPHMPKWFKPTYWTCLDEPPLYQVSGLAGIIKLVPLKYKLKVDAAFKYDSSETSFYLMADEVPGFNHHPSSGLIYSTSIASAAHLAYYMGPKTIYVVGFDCTVGYKASSVNDKPTGITDSPHFYDKPTGKHQYRPVWDSQMKDLLDHFAMQRGALMYNLSKPSASRKIPRGDYRDLWAPVEDHNVIYE